MTDAFVSRISGPVVVGKGLGGAHMFDVVRIGDIGLVGEIIRLEGDTAQIQVYEDTTGIRPGEKIVNTNKPLSVQLGPGLLKSIYDGIQRPLDVLREQSGDFIGRGKIIPARISAVSAPKQRKLAQAIKRARALALLPFVGNH